MGWFTDDHLPEHWNWKLIFSRKVKNILEATTANNAVHIKVQPDGWILEKMANRLSSLDYVSLSENVSQEAELNYFFNYYQYEEVPTPSAAWFTHIEERVPAGEDLWWQVVDAVDICIFHSEKYRALVQSRFPKKHTITISPGVDFSTFTPRKLRIGVIGRAYPQTGRKGEDLLHEIVENNPDVEWVITGKDWQGISNFVPESDLPDLYRQLDYVLITSMYEGGPMSAIEALASGVQVISPEVGWMPELPHISYEAGNFNQLQNIISKLKEPAAELRDSIASRTWGNFVMNHDVLFRNFLGLNI